MGKEGGGSLTGGVGGVLANSSGGEVQCHLKVQHYQVCLGFDCQFVDFLEQYYYCYDWARSQHTFYISKSSTYRIPRNSSMTGMVGLTVMAEDSVNLTKTVYRVGGYTDEFGNLFRLLGLIRT